MYIEIFRMHRNGIYKSKYIDNIKSPIEKNGFSGIFLSKTLLILSGFPDVSNRNSWISIYNHGLILLILHQVEPIIVSLKTHLKLANIYIYIKKKKKKIQIILQKSY